MFITISAIEKSLWGEESGVGSSLMRLLFDARWIYMMLLRGGNERDVVLDALRRWREKK